MTFHIKTTPYDWPHDGLRLSEIGLVIIDMQNDFCSPGGYLDHQGYSLAPMRAPIRNIESLLELFRVHRLPIFFTREGHRADLSDLTPRERSRSRNNPSGIGIGDRGPLGRLLVRGEKGHQIIPELAPKYGEPVVDKPARSAFTHTDFDLLLKVRGVSKLLITGVTTDVCVSTTMRDADDRGYECCLVEDACGASVQELHEAAVEMMITEGGIFGAVASTEAVRRAVEEASMKEDKEALEAMMKEELMKERNEALMKEKNEALMKEKEASMKEQKEASMKEQKEASMEEDKEDKEN